MKFRSQLRRTRPDIIRQIEEVLKRSVIDAGGRITGERAVFSAVFDDDTPFFWLDIFIFIETLKKILDSSKDLFGYSLVISCDPIDQSEQLCRFLANFSGVFLDNDAARKLFPYASMENPPDWFKGRKAHKYSSGRFFRISEIKDFKQEENNGADTQEEIVSALEKEKGFNVLILGSSCFQIKSGIYRYCKKMNGEFPVLSICFGSEGLGALVDTWSARIRVLAANTLAANALAVNAQTEEIDNLWELLFRERVRDEISPFIVKSTKRFLLLIIEYYISAALKKNITPVLVLENIHLAGKIEMNILFDILADNNDGRNKELLVFGLGETPLVSDKQQQWKNIFHSVVTVSSKDAALNIPKLPMDIWEIVCAVSYFGRYFAPELFQRLFEEEKKNPVMIARAFSILYESGVVDNPREPWPLSKTITDYVKKLPDEKAAGVKALVCRRILSWASRRNINPCFRLLSVISSLNGTEYIDDVLLLKSIFSDLIDRTTSSFEMALRNGQLERMVTSQKAGVVRYIFETFKALHSGHENKIHRAFSQTVVDASSFPVLKTQMCINLCAYHLGKRDKEAAVESAKEAILLAQKEKTLCLPQAYRLFALVCLSRQQMSETIEYLDFALTNADKTNNIHEMGISAYYAATAHFLFGDIFKAVDLASKAVEKSLSAARPGWADRSRFLEGRLKFELGNYKDAKNIFEAVLNDPHDKMSDKKSDMLSAWVYRSKVYLNYPSLSKPQSRCHDADLFEIEAAYLAGDFKKAAGLSASLSNVVAKDNFLYTEQPDWQSGFAQCEHLFFSQGEVQQRMIKVFHSLAASRLPSENKEESLQNMQIILRDDRLSDMDPWDAFYFYAWYRILEQTGASSSDMSTAVSIAFKRLQRRAGRIRDVETRRQYLNVPRWNQELSAAAKEFRLI